MKTKQYNKSTRAVYGACVYVYVCMCVCGGHTKIDATNTSKTSTQTTTTTAKSRTFHLHTGSVSTAHVCVLFTSIWPAVALSLVASLRYSSGRLHCISLKHDSALLILEHHSTVSWQFQITQRSYVVALTTNFHLRMTKNSTLNWTEFSIHAMWPFLQSAYKALRLRVTERQLAINLMPSQLTVIPQLLFFVNLFRLLHLFYCMFPFIISRTSLLRNNQNKQFPAAMFMAILEKVLVNQLFSELIFMMRILWF